MKQAIKEAAALIDLFHKGPDRGIDETYINFNCAKQCAILSVKESIKHVRRVDTIDNMEELAHLRAILEALEATPDKVGSHR